MKKTIIALLAAMPFANSSAVVVNNETYYESAKEYGFKGPVKNVSYKVGHESVALAFNKEGMLTQAKSYTSMWTSFIYHVIYGRTGNVSRKVLYDFRDSTCVDCKQISAADINAVEKCKNNEEFVKDRVKTNITYDYDFNNKLIRMVSADVADNYNSIVTEYKYDNAGHMIEQSTFPATNPNKRITKSWAYVGNILVSDNDYDYKYNNKGQLIEKHAKQSSNNSVVYTYYSNGNPKMQYLVGARDTVFFNEKGDTTEVKGKRSFLYRRPDNKLVPEVEGYCVREIMKYNKKRVKTYHQYYNEKGAAVFEKYFDEDGKCVKLVFKKGFINRTYNSDGTVTEQKYINGKLTNTAVFNKYGVCVKEEIFNEDGTLEETIVREADKHGNLTKEEFIKDGKTVKTTTFQYTYF